MIPDTLTAQPPILAAALDLCARGYAVHWLKPRSKAPLTSRWSTAPVHTAASLVQTYRAGYNVGVRCGHWSQPVEGYGLVVLDIDINDSAHIGSALQAAGMLVGLTSRVSVYSGSGHGSQHLWFCCPVDHLPQHANTTLAHGDPLPGTSGRYTWQLELLSTGKNLVVPPSIHPDTGEAYRWEYPLDDIITPAELPLPLLAAYHEAHAQSRPRTSPLHDAPQIPEGGRDEYLFKRAAALRGYGLSEAAIAAALAVENQERCDPPLPDDVVRQKARSAAKYPTEDEKKTRAGRSIGASAARTPSPVDPPPPPDASDRVAWDWLRLQFAKPAFGSFDLLRIENTDPLGIGNYTLFLGGNRADTRIHLGTTEFVLSSKRAQTAIAAATTVVIPDCTRKDWLQIAGRLIAAALPIDVGAHEEAETRAWLAAWMLATHTPLPVDAADTAQLAAYLAGLTHDFSRAHEARVHTQGYFWTTRRRLVLAPTTCLAYIRQHFNQQLRLSTLRQRLHDIGIDRAVDFAQDTDIDVWASGEGFVVDVATRRVP